MSAPIQLFDIEFGDFRDEGGVLHLLKQDCSAVQIYWERSVADVLADCDASSGPALDPPTSVIDNAEDASGGQNSQQPVWSDGEWTGVSQYGQLANVAVSSGGAAAETYGGPGGPPGPGNHDDPKTESGIGASPAQEVTPPKPTEPYIHHMPGGNNITHMNQPPHEQFMMVPHHVTIAHVHVTQVPTSSFNEMYKGTELSTSQPIIPHSYQQNIHPYGGDPGMMPQYHQHHHGYRPNDYRKDNFRSGDMGNKHDFRGMYDDHGYNPNLPNTPRSASKLYEKTYERRNKKKRPRDYYEKLGQEALHLAGNRYGNQMDNYQDMMMVGNMRNHVPYGNGQPGILGMPPANAMNFNPPFMPDTSIPPPGMIPVDLNNMHHLNMGYKQTPMMHLPGNNHPTVPGIYPHSNHILRPRFPEPSAVDVHHPGHADGMRNDMHNQMYPGVPMTQNSATVLQSHPQVALQRHEPSQNVPAASPSNTNTKFEGGDAPPSVTHQYPVNISEPSIPEVSQNSTVDYQSVSAPNTTHLNSQQSDYSYQTRRVTSEIIDTYPASSTDDASPGKLNETAMQDVSRNDINVVNTDASDVASDSQPLDLGDESMITGFSFLGEPLPSVDLSAPVELVDIAIAKREPENVSAESEVTDSEITDKSNRNTSCKVEVVNSQDSVSPTPPVERQPTPEKTTVTTPEESPAGQENAEAPIRPTETVEAKIERTEPAKVQIASDSSYPVNQNLSNTNSSAIPAPSAPKPKATSWASLFKKDSVVSNSIVVYNYDAPSSAGASDAGRTSHEKEFAKEKLPQTVPTEEDKAAKELGEFLLEYKLNHKSVSLQPRGLVNRANWCYVNATLQALLACPPFYHLLKSLPAVRSSDGAPSSTPVMDSLVKFISEFITMSPLKGQDRGSGNKGNKMPTDLPMGSPFEPTYVYNMLQIIQYDAAFKHGRQEDAEEFLSCVLNGLHEEMVAATKFASTENGVGEVGKPNGDVASVSGASLDDEEEEEEEKSGGEEEEEDSQWEQVGPKNKSVITRAANFQKSPAWEMFGGQIRSLLQKQGLKETATLQPFYTLQLDIQSDKVYTLKDALDALVSKESIHGFTCSKTKKEVEASRRITLEELPAILVLHLKCMVYDSKSGGIQKIFKKVDFDVNLDINKDLLSPSARSRYLTNQRQYKLLAVVNHHGSRAVGGHYTTDYFHPGLKGWVNTDDSNIKLVSLQSVLEFVPTRVPYLILYRRADLI